MNIEREWNIPAINNRPISIYALLMDGETMLLGCGLWDRKTQEHSMEIKNATPGMVLRVGMDGKIISQSPQLDNIVYPLIRSPWGGLFAGCRTGAGYFVDVALHAIKAGDFGGGIYGISSSRSMKGILLGCRNGQLVAIDAAGRPMVVTTTSANRLWNLCPDPSSDHIVWASSYEGVLRKIDAYRSRITYERPFGPGALTLICRLQGDMLAVGSLKKKIHLLTRFGQPQKEISVLGGICFIADLPELENFYATDHDGRIYRFDYEGTLLDRFDGDVSRNNPIWIAQSSGPGRLIAAWANGIVRELSL